MAEVTLSYGLRDGVPVHISAITREFNGNDCGCVCPVCGKALQARTLGKSGKAIHFAHQSASNCQPETIIHWTAKYLLAKRINAAITESSELITNWRCQTCTGNFQTDLAKGVFRVEVEKRLDSFIPDVATYDTDNNPILMIEVVNTSPPKPEKLEFAHTRKFELIEFRVTDDASLHAVETSGKLTASKMTPCRQESCGSFAAIAKPKPIELDIQEIAKMTAKPLPKATNIKSEIEAKSSSSGFNLFTWIGVIMAVGIAIKYRRFLKYFFKRYF